MRKSGIFLYGIVAMLMAACGSSEMPEPDSPAQSFRVLNTRQYVSSGQTANIDHLAMMVYGNGELQNLLLLDSSMPQYGTFECSLDKGEYEVAFLGYFTDKSLLFADGPTKVSFTEGDVPNTFLAHQHLSVTAGGGMSESVVLKHVCGCFALCCDDYEEMQNLATMQVRVRGGYNVLNVLTGHAEAQAEDRVTNYSVTSSDFKDGGQLMIYTYLPSDSAQLNIAVTALDASGREIRTRNFEQVPLKVSHRSIYRGNFMGNEGTTHEEETKVNYLWTMEIDEPEWTDDPFCY